MANMYRHLVWARHHSEPSTCVKASLPHDAGGRKVYHTGGETERGATHPRFNSKLEEAAGFKPSTLAPWPGLPAITLDTVEDHK